MDRIIDAFPPEHQHQIRLQLSQVIEGVLSQTLVPKATGRGRVGVFEIMVANGAVRNLIRTNKTFELPSVLQLGQQRRHADPQPGAVSSREHPRNQLRGGHQEEQRPRSAAAPDTRILMGTDARHSSR